MWVISRLTCVLFALDMFVIVVQHSQENGQARSDVAVSDWTTDDVAEWLNDIGFGSYSELLTNQHRVDGRALLRMNESDLRQSPISMNVLGDIKNLALCISQLKAGVSLLILSKHH